MTDVWCPTAKHVPVEGLTGSGRMLGGPPRAVHHTTEGSTIAGAEATYAKTGNGPQITADYERDIVHQHLPANVAATALQNASGGVQTNRFGDVCLQIEWVGSATAPFTAKRKTAGPNVRGLLDWLRALDIPDVWPEGPPPAYGKGGAPAYGADNGERHPKTWTEHAGHYGHSQVPENHHGDPGAVDPAFVRQTNAPVTPPKAKPTQVQPAPAPAPAEETSVFLVQGSGPSVYATDFITKRHVTNQAELRDIKAVTGIAKPRLITDATLAAIPEVFLPEPEAQP